MSNLINYEHYKGQVQLAMQTGKAGKWKNQFFIIIESKSNG